MLGNNLECLKFYRIMIPLFDEHGTQNGKRYYFPETPVLEGKNIVGVEAHLRASASPSIPGDLVDKSHQTGPVSGRLIDANSARYVFVSLYDQNKAEKNYYFPLVSLSPVPAGTGKKLVHPIAGRIKTRQCYVTIPAGAPVQFRNTFYVSLTFYYN